MPKKYMTISELQMDDKVIPLSTDPNEQNKTFMVTDLHPTLLKKTASKDAEYKTVAVSLWQISENHWGPGRDQYGKEHVSRTALYELIERRWNN